MLISGISSSYADKGGVSSYPSGTTVDAGNASVAAAAQQAALEQAANASVVAALASSVANAQTYSAAGLLDSNAQAANALSASPASVPTDGKGAESAAVAESVLQQAVEKEIVANLSAKAVGAGVYNGMGVLESLPFSRVTDLGSLLRYNPQLSFIRVGDSYNQGLIESLNIIA